MAVCCTTKVQLGQSKTEFSGHYPEINIQLHTQMIFFS